MPPAPQAAPAPAASGLRYTCPMDPEVVSDRPGACPKCGMALEPMVTPSGADADAENPELVDMTPRFWIGGGARRSGVCRRRWATWLTGGTLVTASAPARELGRARAGDAGGAVVRLAVLRAHVGVVRQREPEHVHADRHRRGRGVRVQRRRDGRAGAFPTVAHGAVETYFDTSGRHHRARAARTGARAARAAPHGRGDPPAARPGAEDRAGRARTRMDREQTDVPLESMQRGDVLRVRPGEKMPVDGVVVDGERRSTSRWSPASRCPWTRAPATRVIGATIAVNGTCTMRAERVGERDAARADRADGGGRAAHACADSAARRSRRRVLRAGGRCDGGRHVRRVGDCGARAAPRARARERRRRADHRVPVRARPGDADGDHGRHRPGRAGRRAHQERGGARAARARRHARRRQDGHADRRPAARDGRRRCRAAGRTPTAATRRRRRAGQRASARVGDASRRGRRCADRHSRADRFPVDAGKGVSGRVERPRRRPRQRRVHEGARGRLGVARSTRPTLRRRPARPCCSSPSTAARRARRRRRSRSGHVGRSRPPARKRKACRS